MWLCSSDAALAPDEVAGIRWGATPVVVWQTISKRDGVTFNAQTADSLTFKGGDFAGESVESWRFGFTDGKLTMANIRFVRRPGRNENNRLYTDLIFDGPRQIAPPEVRFSEGVLGW